MATRLAYTSSRYAADAASTPGHSLWSNSIITSCNVGQAAASSQTQILSAVRWEARALPGTLSASAIWAFSHLCFHVHSTADDGMGATPLDPASA